VRFSWAKVRTFLPGAENSHRSGTWRRVRRKLLRLRLIACLGVDAVRAHALKKGWYPLWVTHEPRQALAPPQAPSSPDMVQHAR
jgi:hypothetical protein